MKAVVQFCQVIYECDRLVGGTQPWLVGKMLHVGGGCFVDTAVAVIRREVKTLLRALFGVGHTIKQ